MNAKQIARNLVALGFSVVPIVPQGKMAAIPWKPYQTMAMSQSGVDREFQDDHQLGIICGCISGDLEVIDFDTLGEPVDGAPKHFNDFVAMLKEYGFDDLLKKVVISRTPSGGRHLIYRCKGHIQGNLKLANAAQSVNSKNVLIETRGNGGYILAAPSRGYSWEQGDLTSVPTITPDERMILISFAKSFHEKPVDIEMKERVSSWKGDLRPGDEYCKQASVPDLLMNQGWTECGRNSRGSLWVRPGKTIREGISGCLYSDSNVFYNFSSNASDLDHERGYSPFSLFVALEHHGDLNAATRAAANMFGMQKPDRPAYANTLAPIPVLDVEDIKKGFSYSDIEKFDYRAPTFGVFGQFLRSGQINLLDAPESIGKTKMVLKWAANMSKGWCDYYDIEIPQKKTLIFTLEDDPGDLAQSFRECKGREGYLKVYDEVIDLRGDEVKKLDATIRNGDFGLVVFDPLLTYMHGVKDINDPRAVNEYLVPIRKVAMDTGCCIVNIRHFNKNVTDVPRARRAGGSVQFNSCHRSQIVIDWHTEQKGVRVCTHERASNRVKKVEEPFGWDINSSGLIEWIYDNDMLEQGEREMTALQWFYDAEIVEAG